MFRKVVVTVSYLQNRNRCFLPGCGCDECADLLPPYHSSIASDKRVCVCVSKWSVTHAVVLIGTFEDNRDRKIGSFFRRLGTIYGF